MTTTRAVDEDRRMTCVAKANGELGATVNASLVVLGDQGGLHRTGASPRHLHRAPETPFSIVLQPRP